MLRVDIKIRLLAILACGSFFALALLLPFSKQSSRASDIVLPIIFLCFLAGAWIVAFGPFLQLEDDGLRYRNAGTTKTVPYAQIHQVSVGYYGLRIVTNDGSVLLVRAIAKSNYAKMRKIRTVGDDVVTEILLRMEPKIRPKRR